MKKKIIKKSVVRKRLFKSNNQKGVNILAFADTHGDENIFSEIREIRKKEKIDLIICAGDFTMISRKLEAYLNRFNLMNIPFFFVHGNHEDIDKINEFLSERYLKNVILVHKNLIKFKDICFIGYGGEGFCRETPSLEKYIPLIKKDLSKMNCSTKIVITHAPPYKNKLDFVRNYNRGNKSISKLIKAVNADLAFCGHFHETFYMQDKVGKTIVINPGPKGTIIKLDKNRKIKEIKYLEENKFKNGK